MLLLPWLPWPPHAAPSCEVKVRSINLRVERDRRNRNRNREVLKVLSPECVLQGGSITAEGGGTTLELDGSTGTDQQLHLQELL